MAWWPDTKGLLRDPDCVFDLECDCGWVGVTDEAVYDTREYCGNRSCHRGCADTACEPTISAEGDPATTLARGDSLPVRGLLRVLFVLRHSKRDQVVDAIVSANERRQHSGAFAFFCSRFFGVIANGNSL